MADEDAVLVGANATDEDRVGGPIFGTAQSALAAAVARELCSLDVRPRDRSESELEVSLLDSSCGAGCT